MKEFLWLHILTSIWSCQCFGSGVSNRHEWHLIIVDLQFANDIRCWTLLICFLASIYLWWEVWSGLLPSFYSGISFSYCKVLWHLYIEITVLSDIYSAIFSDCGLFSHSIDIVFYRQKFLITKLSSLIPSFMDCALWIVFKVINVPKVN